MKTLHEILNTLIEVKTYVLDPSANIVLTKEQIGETISANHAESVQCLNEGLFALAFAAVDPDMAFTLQELTNKYTKPEQVLFYFQYELNPNLPFSYNDLVYREIKSFGKDILSGKADKENILDAMKRHLVSYYLKFKKMDSVDPELFEKATFAENYISKNSEISYYLMGYILECRPWYEFNGRKFVAILDLYNYMMKKKALIRFSKTIDDDILFGAWLYYLGKADLFETWIKEVQRIDLLDTVNAEKKQVVKKGA